MATPWRNLDRRDKAVLMLLVTLVAVGLVVGKIVVMNYHPGPLGQRYHLHSRPSDSDFWSSHPSAVVKAADGTIRFERNRVVRAGQWAAIPLKIKGDPRLNRIIVDKALRWFRLEFGEIQSCEVDPPLPPADQNAPLPDMPVNGIWIEIR